MIGIYFGGTGNTEFCVEYLLQQIDEKTVEAWIKVLFCPLTQTT